MSSDKFTRSSYESDAGDVYPVRVQPETIALSLGGNANAPTAVAINQKSRARVSSGVKGVPICRGVYMRWSGAPPANYDANGVLFVPVLTRSLYNSVVSGVTVANYLGAAAIVVGKRPERGV